MTVKEIWNSCLYTTLTISTTIFLWSVGSSLKNIANTVNKWNPEAVESHANNVVDHATDKAILVVDSAKIRINEIVNNAFQNTGELSNKVRDDVIVVIRETAARCGVTVGVIINMLHESNAGIGRTIVGNGLYDDRIRDMARQIISDLHTAESRNK